MIKRIVYIMLVAWAAILTAAAQLPHSYQCDFEDAAENSLWVLNYSDFEEGAADPGYRELYVRWLQMAVFLPVIRLAIRV